VFVFYELFKLLVILLAEDVCLQVVPSLAFSEVKIEKLEIAVMSHYQILENFGSEAQWSKCSKHHAPGWKVKDFSILPPSFVTQ